MVEIWLGRPFRRLGHWAGRANGSRAIRATVLSALAERERWILWVPVALGAGVAIYFFLPFEPPPGPGLAALGLGLAATLLWRRHPVVMVAAFGFSLVAAGFALVQWRSAEVAGPVLAEEVGPGKVTGRILRVEAVERGSRLLLDRVSIEDLPPTATPERVRVTVTSETEELIPGTWVDLLAVVSPPYPPVAPGAYDFARRAYFERIGGTGYALGAARTIEPHQGAEARTFYLWLNGLRHYLAQRILTAHEGESGAVAAALLVGERGHIPEDALVAMRRAGLAHLLAISGLHVGLVAGLIFVGLRALLALCEPLALRYPIKKWAAGVTLLAAFAYLLVSGASVPTQRAFLMAGLVFLAVMLDRTSISMRLIAWAAIAVLLVHPESLLGPSFQMSFAAATALVATYEVCRKPLARWQARSGWAMRPLIYLVFVALTTVVATFATGPFAAFHFNRIADYGLVANLAAVPITAFWIMPWGIASFLLMPVGAEASPLQPMGWGIDAVLWVARTVSGWPGAVTLLAAMPLASLVLIALGGLWLCLWRKAWRLLGLVGIAAGLTLWPLARTPDILVDGDGRLFAVRSADGGLALSSKRRARYAGEMWLRRAGEAEPAPWPEDGPSGDGLLNCDDLGCIYRAKGQVAALVSDPLALIDDCVVATVVVSLVPVRGACPVVPVVIDRFDLWREGTHAIWLDEAGVRVQSVAAARGSRPWSVRRGFR